MTQDILVNVGEEYYTKTDLEGVTLDIGFYNDSTDAITDTDNLSAITTEPANTNYSRQSSSFTVSDLSGNWGIENSSSVTFDFSDVQPGDAEAQDIDTVFLVANFQSEDAGDGSASDNLIATAALDQVYSIESIDQFDLNSGDVSVTLD